MPKIKIKDNRPSQGDRKKLLWTKLMNLNLLVYKVEALSRSGFLIISSDDVIERLMTPSVKENLLKDNLEVVTPLEFQANRTIVLRNIDSIITTIDSDELKEDLEQRNDWLKVQEVIKIPTAPKILKIRTENAEMVRAAEEKGILIYNMSVPPSSISRDTFVRLDVCFRCYSFHHKTNDCPTPNVVICSECADNTHTYRNCNNNWKRCINCQGDHRTLSAKCPKRKELIQERAKIIRERSRSRSRGRNITYAQAAASNNQQQVPLNPQLFNREDYVKIVSSIVYAHTIEAVVPGTFHQNVEKMYKLNGLPAVKFPDYVPPPNIEPNRVEEEIRKMRDETELQETIEMETIITERAKRARSITSPAETEQRPKQRKGEDHCVKEMEAVALPPRPSTPLKATDR